MKISRLLVSDTHQHPHKHSVEATFPSKENFEKVTCEIFNREREREKKL